MFGLSTYIWPFSTFILSSKDLICPRCESGFIEEVTEDSRSVLVFNSSLVFFIIIFKNSDLECRALVFHYTKTDFCFGPQPPGEQHISGE